MPRSRRMTRAAEFAKVKAQGTAKGGRFVVVSILADESLGSEIKVGFITTRKLGNAVVRNRVRRRLRAIAREIGGRLKPGHYIVTIARHTAPEAEFAALKADWLRAAERCGALVAD
ncbi:MAG: ribonuclease P protein component [Verrucomicrobiales bacterium]